MAKRRLHGLLPFLLLFLALGPIGCGGDDHRSTIVTQILSDPTVDGDISKDLSTAPPAYSILHASSTGSVLVGILPPASPVESRGFLHFSLGGPGGVPGDAGIASAILSVFVRDVVPVAGTDTVTLFIDLVDFTSPLIASDFEETSLPVLATRSVPIILSDIGREVAIDVTGLMQQAQSLGLPDFQVRIVLDPAAAAGRVEFVDNELVASTRPLLQVEHF
jgi:hypothetical protein